MAAASPGTTDPLDSEWSLIDAKHHRRCAAPHTRARGDVAGGAAVPRAGRELAGALDLHAHRTAHLLVVAADAGAKGAVHLWMPAGQDGARRLGVVRRVGSAKTDVESEESAVVQLEGGDEASVDLEVRGRVQGKSGIRAGWGGRHLQLAGFNRRAAARRGKPKG
jgi:hypothetical protein